MSKHAGKGVSRQFGNSAGRGKKGHSGQKTSDKVYKMQMKDASSGEQRYHIRTGKK